ncbi:MAG: type II toxin-antitoxin system VapC family toxin [Candidatus Omnitrophota bacterium]
MIVIDCSFFLANVFSDEENPFILKVFNAVERGEQDAIAPGIFFYEIHNSLITAVRRNRMKKSQAPDYLKIFALAPINIVESGLPEVIMNMAFSYGLSFYDASYLELAERRNAPLATLDGKLYDAAVKKGLAYSI